MFKIYLYIDGPKFEADRFLQATKLGRLSVRKRLAHGQVHQRYYWRSDEFSLEALAPQGLERLLEWIGPTIDLSREYGDAECVLQIVRYVSSPDEVAGLNLSRRTIQLLSSLGVSLDYDIARVSVPAPVV
jgi:hypothetical protein